MFPAPHRRQFSTRSDTNFLSHYILPKARDSVEHGLNQPLLPPRLGILGALSCSDPSQRFSKSVHVGEPRSSVMTRRGERGICQRPGKWHRRPARSTSSAGGREGPPRRRRRTTRGRAPAEPPPAARQFVSPAYANGGRAGSP